MVIITRLASKAVKALDKNDRFGDSTD